MAITTINLSSFDGSNGFCLDGQQVMVGDPFAPNGFGSGSSSVVFGGNIYQFGDRLGHVWRGQAQG